MQYYIFSRKPIYVKQLISWEYMFATKSEYKYTTWEYVGCFEGIKDLYNEFYKKINRYPVSPYEIKSEFSLPYRVIAYDYPKIEYIILDDKNRIRDPKELFCQIKKKIW